MLKTIALVVVGMGMTAYAGGFAKRTKCKNSECSIIKDGENSRFDDNCFVTSVSSDKTSYILCHRKNVNGEDSSDKLLCLSSTPRSSVSFQYSPDTTYTLTCN